MKTKKMFFVLAMGLAMTSFILTSCKKEVTADDEKAGQYHAESEKVSNDADNIADAAAKNMSSELRLKSALETESVLDSTCAVITRDTVLNTITIDFGTGCVGKDGKTRKGKIMVKITGHYFDAGSSKVITFDNYYVNNNKVEGTRTITNKGQNTSGNYYWSIVAANMKITRADGEIHSWSSTRQREMIAGYGTATTHDDVYIITGDYTGTHVNGDNYTATISTSNPLRREVLCKEFVSGVIEMVNTSTSSSSKITKRSIDYGNGSCDDQATVTVTFKNGKTKTKTITI